MEKRGKGETEKKNRNEDGCKTRAINIRPEGNGEQASPAQEEQQGSRSKPQGGLISLESFENSFKDLAWRITCRKRLDNISDIVTVRLASYVPEFN